MNDQDSTLNTGPSWRWIASLFLGMITVWISITYREVIADRKQLEDRLQAIDRKLDQSINDIRTIQLEQFLQVQHRLERIEDIDRKLDQSVNDIRTIQLEQFLHLNHRLQGIEDILKK